LQQAILALQRCGLRLQRREALLCCLQTRVERVEIEQRVTGARMQRLHLRLQGVNRAGCACTGYTGDDQRPGSPGKACRSSNTGLQGCGTLAQCTRGFPAVCADSRRAGFGRFVVVFGKECAS